MRSEVINPLISGMLGGATVHQATLGNWYAAAALPLGLVAWAFLCRVYAKHVSRKETCDE